MSVNDGLLHRIKSASSQHATLLAEERRLGHDEAVLAAEETQLADRQKEHEDLTRTLSEPFRAKSNSETDNAPRSKVSRIMTRIKAPRAARKAYRAKQAEGQAELQILGSAIKRSQERLHHLHGISMRSKDIQASIDQLHATVFEGEGEMHEEEQAARQACEQAQEALLEAQRMLERHEEAAGYLEQARRALGHAQQKTHDGTAVPFRNSRDDAQRRKHLLIAQGDCFHAYGALYSQNRSVNEVDHLSERFNRAKETQPHITGIDLISPDIANRKIFVDILMTYPPPDAHAFREMIFRANISIHWALEAANKQWSHETHRVKAAKARVETLTEEAAAKRADLSAVRRRLMHEHGASQQPVATLDVVVGVKADDLPAYPARDPVPSY